jgi:hypothetical protein
MSLNCRAAVGTPLAIEQVQGHSGSAFASPMLTAIALVAMMVLATETDCKAYFAGAQFINFLLNPATTALAIPLARNARLIRENLYSISLALLAGSITSIVSSAGWVALGCALDGTGSCDEANCGRGLSTSRRSARSHRRPRDSRWHHRDGNWTAYAPWSSSQRLARSRTCSWHRRKWRRSGASWHSKRTPGRIRSTRHRPERTFDCYPRILRTGTETTLVRLSIKIVQFGI